MSIFRHVIDLGKNCLAGLGAVWAVYNTTKMSFPETADFLNGVYAPAAIASVIIACLLFFYSIRTLKRCKIINLANNNDLYVSFGDLQEKFNEQHGINFIIPVNDYFDTELGNLISSRSVHGAFLGWCFKNHKPAALTRLLNTELKDFDTTKEPSKRLGSKLRYEKPARVCVNLSGNHFYLIPVGKMEPRTLATSLNWTSYPETVYQICEFIRAQGNGRKTYIPLIGDRMSRSGLPSIALLQLLCISIWMTDRKESIGSSLEIVLYEPEKKKFDLRQLQKWSQQIGIS